MRRFKKWMRLKGKQQRVINENNERWETEWIRVWVRNERERKGMNENEKRWEVGNGKE